MNMSFGAVLPSFRCTVVDILYSRSGEPTVRRAELQVPRDPSIQGMRCLAPHCQCAFLASRSESRRPQFVTRKWRGAPRRIPAWVAKRPPGEVVPHSRYGEVVPAPIRYAFNHPDCAAPLGVDMTNSFRDGLRLEHGGLLPSCTVTAKSIILFREVDAALREFAQFLGTISEADDASVRDAIKSGFVAEPTS